MSFDDKYAEFDNLQFQMYGREQVRILIVGDNKINENLLIKALFKVEDISYSHDHLPSPYISAILDDIRIWQIPKINEWNEENSRWVREILNEPECFGISPLDLLIWALNDQNCDDDYKLMAEFADKFKELENRFLVISENRENSSLIKESLKQHCNLNIEPIIYKLEKSDIAQSYNVMKLFDKMIASQPIKKKETLLDYIRDHDYHGSNDDGAEPYAHNLLGYRFEITKFILEVADKMIDEGDKIIKDFIPKIPEIKKHLEFFNKPKETTKTKTVAKVAGIGGLIALGLHKLFK